MLVAAGFRLIPQALADPKRYAAWDLVQAADDPYYPR